MCRYIAVALFLALAFQQSHASNFTIKNGNQICLYAELMVNFSVSYRINKTMTQTASFLLPENAVTTGSNCEVLKLNFGTGNSWSMKFQKTNQTYQAESIFLFFNLSDSKFFPKSLSKENVTLTVHPKITDVGQDTCYSCMSEESITSASVNQTLWNVLIQAYVSNGTLSKNRTVCTADQHTTTPSPTTNSTTTAVPTTNSTTTAVPTTNSTTTAVPTTNSTTTALPTTNSTTTAVPTTTPTPTLPTPTTGNYTVSTNNVSCLLASFGLRIGAKQGDKYEEVNLNPTATVASGSCGFASSQLVLTSDTMNITFTFTNDTKKFHLHVFNAIGKTRSGMAFAGRNNNLSLWEASLSSSYMCNKEQNYSINSDLTLFTFNLRVQPFGVNKGQFSTAHECEMDDISILIPVIVGCVLGGLIVIVVVAYLIGRRKTHAGYQSL